MSRTPDQTDTAREKDLVALSRALKRAEQDPKRPKEQTKEVISRLKWLVVQYTQEVHGSGRRA